MFEPDFHIVILGRPKAQGRVWPIVRGRHAMMIVDPKSRKSKQNFREAIQANAPEIPLDEPLWVETHFYMPRPKSHYGT